MLSKAAFVAGLVSAASLAGAVGTTWTYQGTLVDSGVPASGSYDVQVQLYDAASGGTLLGTQFFNNANVDRGTFTAQLDFGSTFNNGDDRWLAISIRPGASAGALTLLTPRQPVNATPYAQYAEGANELRTRFPNGVLGNEAFVNSQSGEMLIRRDDGTIVVDFGPNATSPSGGEIKLYNDDGNLRYQVDADLSNSTDPYFYFAGSGGGMSMYGDTSGDGFMNLPTGAINATEMYNEPGVASAAEGSGSTSIADTTETTILSRTISCPTSGYVMVIASGQGQVSHANGTSSSFDFGVSDSSTTLPVNQDVAWVMPSSAASGLYTLPMTVHGLFQVGSGSHTFYFLGSKNASSSPSATVFDAQLTCVFIPTSYGTVTSTLLAGDQDIPDDLAPLYPGLTPQEIFAEQQQSIEDYKLSVDAELKAMREQVLRLQAKLEDAPTRPAE